MQFSACTLIKTPDIPMPPALCLSPLLGPDGHGGLASRLSQLQSKNNPCMVLTTQALL